MENGVKIVKIKCPGCGSTLKIPDWGTGVVQCEYCGNEYSIDLGQTRRNTPPPPVPDWKPLPPMMEQQQSSPGRVWLTVVLALVLIGGAGALQIYRNAQSMGEQAALPAAEQVKVPYGEMGSGMNEPASFSGMLGQMLEAAFEKDAGELTEQELARIQWVADRSDLDNSYIGFSFENPLENPGAEMTWLAFPRGSRSGYSELYRCTGLKVLETKESLSQCNLQGLHLEGLSAPIHFLEEAAQAFDDTSSIRRLRTGSGLESLNGLDLFPNIEVLTLNARNLGDVDAVASIKHLRSLTIEDADAIADFSVLASAGELEELVINAENLKSLEFLKRLPGLKSLGLSGGQFLDLDEIKFLENLERLSVEDCDELTDMDSVAMLTGLKELELEKPYDCPEPPLAGLTGLQSLALRGFHSCDFLPSLTKLESLTLQNCDLPSNLDLSGLTKLRKLTFTTGFQDRSLDFVSGLSALEELDLSGMVTYDDISGIFALPGLKKLDISGIECEIAFDRITDNLSLESLEMAGIKLYENVRISGEGGIVNVDWDAVYLAEHIDFLGHFPNLKRLDVADNEIRDLDFAGGLMKLEEIDFSDNYVSDMHILATLPSLRQVNCKGNPISNLRVLDASCVNVIAD